MAIDLEAAKKHVRVDDDEEDQIIATYLAAAKAWVENWTGKLLVRREVVQQEAGFRVYLPVIFGPDPENISITYISDEDAPETITDARMVMSRLYPAAAWPRLRFNNLITITYTAGFTETPADLDAAVLLLVGHWYAHREAVNIGNITAEVPMGVEALCSPYRAVLV